MPPSLDAEVLQSKVITFLRFPLMVGVVFIHASIRPQTDTSFFYEIHRLFSVIIPSVSVPFFFFISGYLFFYKLQSTVKEEDTTKFNWSEYSQKTRKRFKTLFIPYVLWCTAWIFLCLCQIPFISTLFKAYPSAYPLAFDFVSLLNCFWATPIYEVPGAPGVYPIIIQFWFIRDLMILMALSPIFYWGIKKLKYFFPLALFGLYFELFGNLRLSSLFSVSGFSFVSFSFFILGAEYAIKQRLWLQDFLKLKIPVFLLYPIVMCLDLILRNNIIHKIQILVGIVFFANLAVRCVLIRPTKRIKSFLLFLSSSSFFLFAFHQPWLMDRIRDGCQLIIPMSTDIFRACAYFLQLFLCIVLSVVIYYFLKRFFPKFTNLITGGR